MMANKFTAQTPFPGAAADLALGFFRRATKWRPHPAKAATGGEDAFLATDYCIGVADGVGYWDQTQGISAGAYSEGLMRSVYDFCEQEYGGQHCVPCMEALRYAYDDNKDITGTSTALLASLCGSNLEIASVGDCTVLVLRGGKVLYRNEEQYHSLNFPYQLGTGSKDLPNDCERANIQVQPGDLVIMGSDGIFDNLYDRDVFTLMEKTIQFVEKDVFLGEYTLHDGRTKPQSIKYLDATQQSLLSAVDQLIDAAILNVNDPRAATPFAEKCIESGAYYEGGKDDDMTCIISCVGPDNAALLHLHGDRFAKQDEDSELISVQAPYKHWP